MEILSTADYTGSTPRLDIGSEIQAHILDDPGNILAETRPSLSAS